MSEPAPARREAISVLQNTDSLTDSLSVGKQGAKGAFLCCSFQGSAEDSVCVRRAEREGQ